MPEVSVVRGSGQLPTLPLVRGRGTARALVWPGMGARCRSLHHIQLEPGSRTIDFRHEGEAVYYVLSGAAIVTDVENERGAEASAGSVIHVEPSTLYFIAADGGETTIVGGPCPPDPSLYSGGSQ